MSEVTVNKRHLSLPWTVALSLVIGVASGTGVFYALKADVTAAHVVGTDARAFAERVERDATLRLVQAERRIEKLEEVGDRTVLLLERIDERTIEMKRRLDAVQPR